MSHNFDLIEKLLRFNDRHRLFSRGQSILVGVSGGVDSVVLLHLFDRIRESWQLGIYVAHLNHQLRGDEADKDEAFVAELCQKMNVPCYSERWDVSTYARAHKLSLETAARQVRYQFFKVAADKFHCQLIATAHNANDQAETILDHLMRGTGVAGLAGIPVKRDRVIRPLLFADRKEIEGYARDSGLEFRRDSTNEEIIYRRNKIRHILMKIVQDFNPNAVQTLSRLGLIMRETDEYLQVQAEQALKSCQKHCDSDKIILDIIAFLAYFKVLQKYMIQIALNTLSGRTYSINFHQFEDIQALLDSKKSGTFIRLHDGILLGKSGSELFIGRLDETDRVITIDHIPGKFDLWDGYILEIKQVVQPLEKIIKNKDRNIAFVDSDKLSLPLIVRTPKPGDRFFPLNLKGRKKLSDFFIDEKIPYHRRHTVPIVECQHNIVWIGGHRLDDRFKVTEKTKKIIQFKLSRQP